MAAVYPSTEKERNQVPSTFLNTARSSPLHSITTASIRTVAPHSYPFRMQDPFASHSPSQSESLDTRIQSDNDPMRMPGISGSDENQVPDHPNQAGLYASEEMLALLVPNERIEALWDQIETLEEQAITDPSSDHIDINANLNKLQKARNYLLAGRRHYEQAEALAGETEARLSYKARVRIWSYTWGLLILVYSILCLATLGLGVSRVNTLISPDWQIYGIAIRSLLITSLTGALGGVTGALYSLWVHVAKKQDFDRQHLMWYLTNPLMGGVLGLFVFLAFQAGISTLSLPVDIAGNSALPLYTFAWLSGFQQNVAYHLVHRAIKAILKLGGNTGLHRQPTPSAKN